MDCDKCENYKRNRYGETAQEADKCDNYKSKQHFLDDLIDDISKASGGIGRVTSLSKKLRYESIKWAWNKLRLSSGEVTTENTNEYLRECHHKDWIVEDK